MTDKNPRADENDAARRQAARDADEASRRSSAALAHMKSGRDDAAQKLDESADSHVKAARLYDDGAEQRPARSTELQEHATRHRQSANEERKTAQQLRDIADNERLPPANPR